MNSRVPAGLFLSGILYHLCAQAPSGTMVGTVVDPSGSAVAGAKVEVRNSGTDVARSALSDQKGEFITPGLSPGVYDVTIVKDGFRILRQKNIEMQVDQEVRLQFSLELGPVSQTVEVVGSAPLVNTENSVKGDVVTAQEMVELPLNGRNFTDLAFLVPGVLPKAQGGDSSSTMSVNGARPDNTNFLIDGFNDRNPRDASAQATPNLDAMQEFKMQTTGYSAETGRMAGGVLSMVLKSGTNQLHGALFEFLRNNDFDARNFFTATNAELRRNQFGGLVSGPVVLPKLYNGRNRTFFLFSWESYRQRQGASGVGVVPTVAQRQGDFSGFSPIKDPFATGTFFPANQIPQSLLSPQALAVQAYYPSPNHAGPNNLYTIAAEPSDWDSYVIKIDENLSPQDTLSFRYMMRYTRANNPFNSGITGLFGDPGWEHDSLAGLTYTRMFGPTLINEARLALTRTAEIYNGSHTGTDYNKLFGIAGGSTDPELVGFPLFSVSGYTAIGDGANLPVDNTVSNYHFSDTLTWVKGSHLVKLGGDILHTQMFFLGSGNTNGTYSFAGTETTQPYADFLLGLPSSTSRLFQWARNYVFANSYGLFIQDDWKVSSRLTLNLGLRYELPLSPSDKYGRWSNFIPELGKLVIASDATLAGTGIGFTNSSQVETAAQAGLPSSLLYADYKDFAPRFGIAWRPFGGNQTVIRGGYGIFYGVGGDWADVRNTVGNIFPFAVSESVNSQPNNPSFLTLANPFPVSATLTSNVVNVAGTQLHAPTPYIQSWNLTTERQIGRNTAIEIGYVGSKGTHLPVQININQPFRSAALSPNFPVPYAGWSTINYYAFCCNSNYNAASVTLRRRFASNFFYRVNYTYSKSIDEGSQLQGVSTGGAPIQNPRDLAAERGRSDFDLRHSFTTSFSWVAPWRTNVALRGWQLAGTAIAQTGMPFTPQLSNVNLNLGTANRPNRTAKGTVPNPTPDQWFDVADFPAVPNGSFAFGNSGRNILDGPGMLAVNLSLIRNFAVREKSKLQFRWEVFNALNHANFTLPVDKVNQVNAATITSAGAPRQMQVALHYSF